MDTAAARKRCEAAKPGPWRATGFDGLKEGANYHDFSIIASQIGDEDIFITNIGPFFCPVEVSKEQAADEWATAEFIAHARTDLPAALEALEEAQGKLEAVQKLPAELAAHLDKPPIVGNAEYMRGWRRAKEWFVRRFDAILRGTKEGDE